MGGFLDFRLVFLLCQITALLILLIFGYKSVEILIKFFFLYILLVQELVESQLP